MVFIPGHSGLSVNHAFSYGRAYFTIGGKDHGPEIEYIKHGINGGILGSDMEKNIQELEEYFLGDSTQVLRNAFDTGLELSVENWCEQFYGSLNS